MKVSRVVLIVVALHVLVIGGIFVFEGCSRSMKATTPDMAANESQPGEQPSTLPAATQATDAGAQMTTATTTTPGTQGLTPATPAATTATPPATQAYTVKKGDSLWKIAKTEGVSIAELASANNLTKTSTLQIGQKLQIPQATAKTTTDATVTASATETGGQTYTVMSGDSLWKIAHTQNITVSALKQANNLSSDSLKIGQKLRIPTPTATTTTANTTTTTSTMDWHEPGTATENGQMIHYVDVGESAGVIARKYGIRTSELLHANNITDKTALYPGQRLVIPTAQQPTTVAAAAPVTTVSTQPAAAAPIVSATTTATVR